MTKSAKVKKNLNVRIVRAIDHHHLNARITRIDHFDRQACSAMSICESQIVMDIVQTLMTSIWHHFDEINLMTTAAQTTQTEMISQTI